MKIVERLAKLIESERQADDIEYKFNDTKQRICNYLRKIVNNLENYNSIVTYGKIGNEISSILNEMSTLYSSKVIPNLNSLEEAKSEEEENYYTEQLDQIFVEHEQLVHKLAALSNKY